MALTSLRHRTGRRRLRANLATVLFVMGLLAASASPAAADDNDGEWGSLIQLPILPIHNVVMPDGRVMLFGSDDTGTAGEPNSLQYVIWDPSLGTGASSLTLNQNTSAVDLFCAAQLVEPSTGAVFTAGGDIGPVGTAGNIETTFFDPATDTLSTGARMQTPRWYPTMITLANGDQLIMGGSIVGGEGGQPVTTPEVFNAETGWRPLPGADSTFAFGKDQNRWWYPRAWVLSDGRMFGLSGSSMFYVDPAGDGDVIEAGTFPTGNIGVSSTAVMYAPDTVLQVGGGTFNNGGGGPASPVASIVDLSGPTPVVSETNQPALNRHWGSTLLLADGTVLLSGGAPLANNLADGFHDTAEIWDPATGEWTSVAAEGQARLYHQSTILLPDATVFSNGGGDPGPIRQKNGTIFTPPYLFDGDQLAPRPAYSLAQSDFRYGDTATLSVSGRIRSNERC